MALNITFDYRFFNDLARKALMEAAAAEFENIIQDEFAEVSAITADEIDGLADDDWIQGNSRN